MHTSPLPDPLTKGPPTHLAQAPMAPTVPHPPTCLATRMTGRLSEVSIFWNTRSGRSQGSLWMSCCCRGLHDLDVCIVRTGVTRDHVGCQSWRAEGREGTVNEHRERASQRGTPIRGTPDTKKSIESAHNARSTRSRKG